MSESRTGPHGPMLPSWYPKRGLIRPGRCWHLGVRDRIAWWLFKIIADPAVAHVTWDNYRWARDATEVRWDFGGGFHHEYHPCSCDPSLFVGPAEPLHPFTEAAMEAEDARWDDPEPTRRSARPGLTEPSSAASEAALRMEPSAPYKPRRSAGPEEHDGSLCHDTKARVFFHGDGECPTLAARPKDGTDG